MSFSSPRGRKREKRKGLPCLRRGEKGGKDQPNSSQKERTFVNGKPIKGKERVFRREGKRRTISSFLLDWEGGGERKGEPGRFKKKRTKKKKFTKGRRGG